MMWSAILSRSRPPPRVSIRANRALTQTRAWRRLRGRRRWPEPLRADAKGPRVLGKEAIDWPSKPTGCTLDVIWSGRWESNPRNQLGRLAHYHCATPAFAHRLVARRGFEPLISGLKGRRPSPLDERARRHRLCRKRHAA